jgi:hypothetical protein
MTKIP